MKKTLKVIVAILLGLFTANGITNLALVLYTQYFYSEQSVSMVVDYITPATALVLWIVFFLFFWKLLRYYKKPAMDSAAK